MKTQEQIQAQAELDAACESVGEQGPTRAQQIGQCQEALDEVVRELGVRERCFPKWVAEGRISNSDAKDRLRRQILAQKILLALLDTLVRDQ